MKLMVIGLGQCGNRIADEFARLGRKAQSSRGVEILTDTFAVDTDTAALRGLQTIKQKQKIVIGETKTRGHGVGKQSELGAQIAKEDGFKIIDAIRETRRFSETDAFLLIAGAAGGTGSGAIPIMSKLIKERHMDRPVYALIVLPFEHEEEIEKTNVRNTAACLDSVFHSADAVFLIDNQRFAGKGLSLGGNIAKINRLIVKPFFGLLSAGEERKRKNIGVSMLDAGDMVQTLSGWTAMGYGQSPVHLITFPWDKPRTRRVIKAMDGAISELSVGCDIKKAAKALYLLSAPENEINLEMVKHLGDHLRNLAPAATIKYGDYPINKGSIDVTIILSALESVDKVNGYFTRFPVAIEEVKARQEIQPPGPA